MKKKRRKVSLLLCIVVLCTGLTGCNVFPKIENSTSVISHISQDEKEKAAEDREYWINNRIEYIPTPSPTPKPTLTPTPKLATVTCTNKTYPSSVKKGESFNIGGLITASVGTIDKVTGYFMKKDGTVVTKAIDKPKSSTYEIMHSDIDHKLAFGDLKTGDYICVIKAKGSNFPEIEVMRFNFSISTKTVIATELEETKPTPTIEAKKNTSKKPSKATPTPIPTPPQVAKDNSETKTETAKQLTEAEKTIIDRVKNAGYPKNCKIVITSKKSNDAGYEYYKIVSKYDQKSVSTIIEYEDDSSDIEASDIYITTVGNTIKRLVYVDGYGWKQETVNKYQLTPEGNRTDVSISISDYLSNTTGGQWELKTSSSEYVVTGTGIKDKANNNIEKDITITTDRNYEIKNVTIKIYNSKDLFKRESGYTTNISIKVSDKGTTKVSVPSEALSEAEHK